MSEPIWSTGGVGGERAVTDDLEWAVGALRAAADDICAAQLELARRRALLTLDPSVGHAVAIAELGRAADSTAPALEAELDDTARRLSSVAGAYIAAERKARYRVGAATTAREILEDDVGTQWWLTRVVGAAVFAATPVGMSLLANGHSGIVTGILPDGAPPTTALLTRDAVEASLDIPAYPLLAAAIDAIVAASILSLLTTWQGQLTRSEVPVEPTRSLADIMARLRDTEMVPGGAVRIERWTGDDGVTRRVVFIPGTKDWLNVTGNPFDSEADLALMAGRLPDAATMVAAALEADGAGPGDPVLLTGHSLGGIVATALAGNAAFAARFNVAGLVTAGAPTGRIALPATVNALHFEGTRDIVPGLDGRPNPDAPTRITVHHDARESQLPALAKAAEDIGSAHHLDTYEQTARLVDQGLSPSTDAWRRAEADFFSPTADAVATEYRPSG